MQPVLFYCFSVIAILSALCVITQARPTRALLFLIVAMFALSILYMILNAPFVAFAHLIVYAGAVLILFLFVIMLQGIGASELPVSKRFPARHLFFSGLTGISFLGVLLYVLSRNPLPRTSPVAGTIENVGQTLFQNYLLPFELTSVLLLVGVFAAVSLAKKEDS